ncbi:gluconate:H+ symporter [Saccharopolyspora sp. NFXS83]|uniref:GntT/GntP/DsdX family permease n=1 Tax=Saccharopolyspora sp. NFXS83 TaxID=2993560 RepID=UPI00224B8DAE|nr:gluconate:H+ symporter [Saccharopolyspora sp. NFXS83]MCX2734151.1 gluconate:H+ symporter [Saccharopolyspora sp. NFXS83]
MPLMSLPVAGTLLAQAPPGAWSSHDTRLLAAAVSGIAVIVVLISWVKMHPFLALALGATTLGVVAGMPFEDLVDTFTEGLGKTVGDVGLLVALGAMLGRLLTDTGGAQQIVETVLERTTRRTLPWAMVFIAALLGLPMFFEVGVVLLVPIVVMVAARSEQPMLRIGIPALAGLSILHGLVPPHPGPLAAVDALGVDLGTTLALGIVVAIPTAVVAGPLFGSFIAKRVELPPASTLLGKTPGPDDEGRRPGFALSVVMLLLPVVLMLGKSVADLALTEGSAGYVALDTLGTPVVALTLTVLIAMATLGPRSGLGRTALSGIIGGSLPPVAGIILIVGAGGGFKETLVNSGVNTMITDVAAGAHLSPLLLAWLIAVGIRVATGSATVATISAAGMVAPLVAGLDPVHGALVALAIGSGSLFLSHVNDAGFWLVKEYFGMTVGQTLKTWSAMETILSVVSFVVICLLEMLL